MAEHFQKVLALADLNFLKLKQIYYRGGAALTEELMEAFAQLNEVIPPGELKTRGHLESTVS